MSTDFEIEKAAFLRFSETLRKAQSPEQLLALLQADIEAPYHSFNPLHLATITENVGEPLAGLMDAVLAKRGGFYELAQG